MPWTRYYDPQGSAVPSIFTWSATIFELVLKKPEFWLYIVWNILMTTLCKFWVKKGHIQDFEWDAATVMQYVMTFFVTFYNDRCFERYNALYPSCQDFQDAVVFFTQEMNVSLHHEQLQNHRIACVKYLLAAVYEYYMIVCGGKLSNRSWRELTKKGLLTADEAHMLEKYPGGQTTFVLTSWVLFIIRDALQHDCLWVSGGRHQQTVHIYNRHCRQIVAMMKAAHRIGHTMAMPIPFAYYHLMNLILVFNVILLATFPALFRSYWTVLPFFVALLIYMGLREVSTALADPFNQDSVDFPIPGFISQTFDRAVCLLLSFIRPETRRRVLDQVEQCQEFSPDQLMRVTKKGCFASDKRGLHKGIGIQCKWNHPSVFENETNLTEKRSKKNAMMVSLFEHEDEEASEPDTHEDNEIDEETIEAERKMHEATERREALQHELKELKDQLEKIRDLSSTLFDEHEDELHDHEAHVHDKERDQEHENYEI